MVWSRAFSQSYFFLIFGFIYETTFIITYKPRASILICSKASFLARDFDLICFTFTWQFFCYLSKRICPLLTWLRVLFARLNAANITQESRGFLGRLPDLLYTLLKPKQNHPNRQMKLNTMKTTH